MSFPRSLLVMFMVVCVLGCLGWVGKRVIFAPETKTVRIGIVNDPSGALIHVANSQGYFGDEYLTVELEPYPTAELALDALAAGNVDYAVTYDTPLIMAVGGGQRIKVLTELYSSTSNTGLVFRRDHGIRIPADIKGKKVGLPMGTSAEFAMDLFLASYAIPRESVHLVNTNSDRLALSLIEKKVDAVVSVEPHATTLQQSNRALFGRIHSDFYNETAALVVKGDDLEQRHEEILRVLSALAEASEFYRSSLRQSQKIVEHAIGLQTQAVADAVWERARPHLGLSSQFVGALRREFDWFKKRSGRLPAATTEIEECLEPRFLEEVAPELVTFD